MSPEWERLFHCLIGIQNGPYVDLDVAKIIDILVKKWGLHQKCRRSHDWRQCNGECAADITNKAEAATREYIHGWTKEVSSHTPQRRVSATVELPDDIWRLIARKYLHTIHAKKAIAGTCLRLTKLFMLPVLIHRARRMMAFVNKLEQRDK
jgi:hypothetical protein